MDYFDYYPQVVDASPSLPTDKVMLISSDTCNEAVNWLDMDYFDYYPQVVNASSSLAADKVMVLTDTQCNQVVNSLDMDYFAYYPSVVDASPSLPADKVMLISSERCNQAVNSIDMDYFDYHPNPVDPSPSLPTDKIMLISSERCNQAVNSINMNFWSYEPKLITPSSVTSSTILFISEATCRSAMDLEITYTSNILTQEQCESEAASHGVTLEVDMHGDYSYGPFGCWYKQWSYVETYMDSCCQYMGFIGYICNPCQKQRSVTQTNYVYDPIPNDNTCSHADVTACVTGAERTITAKPHTYRNPNNLHKGYCVHDGYGKLTLTDDATQCSTKECIEGINFAVIQQKPTRYYRDPPVLSHSATHYQYGSGLGSGLGSKSWVSVDDCLQFAVSKGAKFFQMIAGMCYVYGAGSNSGGLYTFKITETVVVPALEEGYCVNDNYGQVSLVESSESCQTFQCMEWTYTVIQQKPTVFENTNNLQEGYCVNDNNGKVSLVASSESCQTFQCLEQLYNVIQQKPTLYENGRSSVSSWSRGYVGPGLGSKTWDGVDDCHEFSLSKGAHFFQKAGGKCYTYGAGTSSGQAGADAWKITYEAVLEEGYCVNDNHGKVSLVASSNPCQTFQCIEWTYDVIQQKPTSYENGGSSVSSWSRGYVGPGLGSKTWDGVDDCHEFSLSKGAHFFQKAGGKCYTYGAGTSSGQAGADAWKITYIPGIEEGYCVNDNHGKVSLVASSESCKSFQCLEQLYNVIQQKPTVFQNSNNLQEGYCVNDNHGKVSLIASSESCKSFQCMEETYNVIQQKPTSYENGASLEEGYCVNDNHGKVSLVASSESCKSFQCLEQLYNVIQQKPAVFENTDNLQEGYCVNDNHGKIYLTASSSENPCQTYQCIERLYNVLQRYPTAYEKKTNNELGFCINDNHGTLFFSDSRSCTSNQCIRANPKADYIIVTSGLPTRDLSEAQCREYASLNSYAFGIAFEIGNPSGCFEQTSGSSGSVYFNNADTGINCGAYGVSNCVERTLHCQNCAPGRYDNDITKGYPQDNKCLQCSTGQYQDIAGSTSCKDCAVGRYNDQKDQTDCEDCEAGKGVDVKGATSCDTCVAGKFGAGGTACEDCAQNYIAVSDGLESCTACDSHDYTPSTGSTTCLPRFKMFAVNLDEGEVTHNNKKYFEEFSEYIVQFCGKQGYMDAYKSHLLHFGYGNVGSHCNTHDHQTFYDYSDAVWFAGIGYPGRLCGSNFYRAQIAQKVEWVQTSYEDCSYRTSYSRCSASTNFWCEVCYTRHGTSAVVTDVGYRQNKILCRAEDEGITYSITGTGVQYDDQILNKAQCHWYTLRNGLAWGAVHPDKHLTPKGCFYDPSLGKYYYSQSRGVSCSPTYPCVIMPQAH